MVDHAPKCCRFVDFQFLCSQGLEHLVAFLCRFVDSWADISLLTPKVWLIMLQNAVDFCIHRVQICKSYKTLLILKIWNNMSQNAVDL